MAPMYTLRAPRKGLALASAAHESHIDTSYVASFTLTRATPPCLLSLRSELKTSSVSAKAQDLG